MKPTFLLFLSVVLCGLGGSRLAAETIVETAPSGYPIAPGTGLVVGAGFLGVRFEVSQPVQLTSVGAVLSQFDPAHAGPIEAAVVQLTGPTDFPNSPLLTTPDVLVRAYLNPGPDFAELSEPLSALLVPGWYALLYGTRSEGDFVASAKAPSIAYPTDARQYIVSREFNGQWYESLGVNPRFFLEAMPVPEPSAGLLGMVGLGALAARRGWRRLKPQGQPFHD
jgi:hypothetical protein